MTVDFQQISRLGIQSIVELLLLQNPFLLILFETKCAHETLIYVVDRYMAELLSHGADLQIRGMMSP